MNIIKINGLEFNADVAKEVSETEFAKMYEKVNLPKGMNIKEVYKKLSGAKVTKEVTNK